MTTAAADTRLANDAAPAVGIGATLGELQAFQWTCPYCHRGFAGQGYKRFRPARLVCRDCSDHYDAKVQALYQLDEAGKETAYRIGQMPECREKREVLARWQQFADKASSVKAGMRWSAMVELARSVRGQPVAEPKPAKPAKATRSWHTRRPTVSPATARQTRKKRK